MSTVSGFFCSICFFGSLVVAGYAQEAASAPAASTKDTIESWLLGGDPRMVAWGAAAAVVANDPALTPDLIEVADRWQPLPQPDVGDPHPISLTADQLDQRDATAAVLDALIQTKAPTPTETLRNLAADFPDYVAILLGQLPIEDSQSLAFDLYRAPPRNASNLQYVAAALLLEAPPPGFAADLLGSIEVRATIYVVDPGIPHGIGGSVGLGGCADGTYPPRTNWPTFGIYHFSLEKTSQSLLVVSGPQPVYAGRYQSDRYFSEDGPCSGALRLDAEERRDLIARMLSIQPEDIGWELWPSKEIEFKSEPQFYADLQKFISAEQAKYRATTAALAADNLMTQSEAQDAIPQLNVHLVDARSRGRDYAPIAKPRSLPPHVTWSVEP